VLHVWLLAVLRVCQKARHALHTLVNDVLYIPCQLTDCRKLSSLASACIIQLSNVSSQGRYEAFAHPQVVPTVAQCCFHS
jgi:hypothetical protein